MNYGIALAQFGTFDVENYGDLLYPIVFQKMFEQRGGITPVPQYSLKGSDDLQESGYKTQPIQKLFSSRGLPQTLLIGGGDLLRTDWDVMASHYRPIKVMQEPKKGMRKLRRLFAKLSKEYLNPDVNFRRRYMNYSAAGPFIIRPGTNLCVNSVAYCSCGVPFDFDESIAAEVAGTFDGANFIYVRDHASKNALVQAGVTKEIHVAPDLIVTLSDFFDAKAERGKGKILLQSRGVNTHRPILVFESNPQPPEKTEELVRQLKSYQARTGCEVVMLPIGFCHGDREFLKKIAGQLGGAFRYVEMYSIFDIISILAAADVFLGTSLHGNVTAFSFGIPHLFGPIPVRKREGFLEVANLPKDLKLDSWAEMNSKLDRTVALGREFFLERGALARRQVHEVVDELCGVLNIQRAPARVEAQLACG